MEFYAYVALDLNDHIQVDPDNFYKKSYEKTLKEAVKKIVEEEYPVHFEVIVKRIREAHGFKQAGGSIKRKIQSALKGSRNNSGFYCLEVLILVCGTLPEVLSQVTNKKGNHRSIPRGN